MSEVGPDLVFSRVFIQSRRFFERSIKASLPLKRLRFKLALYSRPYSPSFYLKNTPVAMLTQLTIRNFAIASHLEIDFHAGMTVLTGETGAGKSILLGALGLSLGDRADSDLVRFGEAKAEICASFDISSIPQAKAWLEERDLEQDNECILRRVVTAEGRSRAYINGRTSTLADIKILGEQLIDVHSQHEHQSLLVKEKHRALLDDFAGNATLAKEVREHFQAWQRQAQKYDMLINNQEETEARLQVLTFQVDELDKLALQDGEIELLEAEQNRLANAEVLLKGAHEAIECSTNEDGGALSTLLRAKQALINLPSEDPTLSESLNMLEEASIQIDEATANLRHFIDGFDLNPARLSEIEERLSTAYQLARKHRCQPEELIGVHLKLSEELSSLSGGDQDLATLEQEIADLKAAYMTLAQKLRTQRLEHALLLESAIGDQLALMSMQNVIFKAQVDPLDERNANINGVDDIEFLISTNPGQPPKALAKIASGGELSRISLAIQVVLAQKSSVPSMVFDEIDVGIGGGTAEVVGRLLKQLGSKGQVICITHQAQVASQGEHHLKISKSLENEAVHSAVEPLDQSERVEEIARMLGGIEITEQTKAHASEMLSLA